MQYLTTLKLRHNNSVQAGIEIRNALQQAKVVKVTPEWHISDLRAFYDSVTDQIGKCVLIGEDFTKGGVQTGEKWLEIRYDHDIPDLAAYRHSKNAQPLHTDESYITDPADIMFFYCVNKAEFGGATTFIDGPALVAHLKNYDPQLFEDLTKTEVTYKKADQYRRRPIITFNEKGMPLFNYNYYCVARDETDFNKELNKRFFEYLEDQVAHSYLIQEVYLNPGEAVAWWDEYVLHGRNAFKAEKTNDRFIWKAGIKWTNN
ncbi:MAG: TauD/TfdA family dioxygenase [Flavisolibacter sp.]|nr:TauD/TfdA family dioxygenase [Flavisolibacter sp.]MBD0366302.1 TauD/TfdA family dioxygenase [Flavisolibacter sp.]MBD0376609.1 TauD/TfdA family dioxygenase [Flavisolibacter sp.]